MLCYISLIAALGALGVVWFERSKTAIMSGGLEASRWHVCLINLSLCFPLFYNKKRTEPKCNLHLALQDKYYKPHSTSQPLTSLDCITVSFHSFKSVCYPSVFSSFSKDPCHCQKKMPGVFVIEGRMEKKGKRLKEISFVCIRS